jgi:predicted AlkP superfamily pyrophosphatase or phosphodiesterase
MIHISPVFAKFGTYADQLVEAGLDVDQFLDFPGFAAQLEAAGVETHAIKGREIVDSALSKMHGRGLTGNHGAVSFADMLVQTRELLAADPQQRMFISTYWPSVDSMSHRYGWNHPRTQAELRALFAQIAREWLEGMPAAARQGTALLITADHGQVICPPAQRVVFSDHPQLQEMLFMRPLGEPRVVYLYAKHGRTDDIISYVQEHLAHAMVPLRSAKRWQPVCWARCRIRRRRRNGPGMWS